MKDYISIKNDNTSSYGVTIISIIMKFTFHVHDVCKQYRLKILN